MNFENLQSEIEQAEQEAEGVLQEKADLEMREANLRSAVAQLQEDAALSQSLNEQLNERASEREAAQQRLEDQRSRAEDLESQLLELLQQTENSAEVLSQLSQLGEDVNAGIGILKDRQLIIRECMRQLEELKERLGMNGQSDRGVVNQILSGLTGSSEEAHEQENPEEGKTSDSARSEEPDTPTLEPNRKTPRDLAATQYGFTEDSDGNQIYDSPTDMDQYLYKDQGSANLLYRGTCGLCSCANILRLAGVKATEKKILNYARSTKDPNDPGSKLCQTGYFNASLNGGTTPKNRKQILEHFGISSSLISVISKEDGSPSEENVTRIAEQVSSGRGVILSVHANILWYDAPAESGDNHAVTVTSVKKDKDGQVLGFFICDSANDGTTFYSADRVQRSLTGAPMNVTHQIIR